MFKKIATLFLSSAMLLSIAFGAIAATNSTDTQKTIQVYANAEDTFLADIAYLNVGFSTYSKDSNIANKNAVIRTKNIVSALKKVGVKDSQIKTTSISQQADISQEQEFANTKYQSTVSLLITVSDVKNIQKIVDTATKAGATSISDIKYDLKDNDSAYNQVLKKALIKAKEQAKVIAQTTGMQLGDALTAYDSGYYSMVSAYDQYGMAPAQQNIDYVEIPKEGLGGAIKAGEIRITSSVNITYSCK